MKKAFRNSAVALTIIGGVALLAAPASANTVTKHEALVGNSSKTVGLTDVGWRRYYRHWGPPIYDAPPDYYAPPAYYEPYYGPEPGFSITID